MMHKKQKNDKQKNDKQKNDKLRNKKYIPVMNSFIQG